MKQPRYRPVTVRAPDFLKRLLEEALCMSITTRTVSSELLPVALDLIQSKSDTRAT